MRALLDLLHFALLVLLVFFTWNIMTGQQELDVENEMYKCCVANWSKK